MDDRLPGEGLAELVELGDPAALLRAVDGLCASRDWAGLVDLRHLLEEAVERGRPLWPVTTYVEYRMGLDGPAPEAASVLRPGAARFALGPLTEVAATTHTFAERSLPRRGSRSVKREADRQPFGVPTVGSSSRAFDTVIAAAPRTGP